MTFIWLINRVDRGTNLFDVSCFQHVGKVSLAASDHRDVEQSVKRRNRSSEKTKRQTGRYRSQAFSFHDNVLSWERAGSSKSESFSRVTFENLTIVLWACFLRGKASHWIPNYKHVNSWRNTHVICKYIHWLLMLWIKWLLNSIIYPIREWWHITILIRLL